MDYSKALIAGRFTRDPEIRTTEKTTVLNFSLAVNRKYNGKESTSFLNFVAWGKSAEIINTYMRKGDNIFIDGRLETEQYQNNEGKNTTKTFITVENFQFLGSKKANNEEQESAPRYPEPPEFDAPKKDRFSETLSTFEPPSMPSFQEPIDEEVPF